MKKKYTFTFIFILICSLAVSCGKHKEDSTVKDVQAQIPSTGNELITDSPTVDELINSVPGIDESTDDKEPADEPVTDVPSEDETDEPDTTTPDAPEPEQSATGSTTATEPLLTESGTLHFIDAWGEWHDAEIVPGIAAHPYQLEQLTITEDGVSYTGDDNYTVRRGIDVSKWQGSINWDKVKAEGIEFVIIRLGFRGYGQAGNIKLDLRFHENMKGAKEAGLLVGVYFYAQAINEEEAIEEAEFVLDALEGYELDLPVVYDPELIRDDTARTDNVTGEQFTKNTIAFCETIKAAGYEPMIYSNMIWEAFLFDMTALQDYPFWYADYEPLPQTPYDFTFWQYSEKGKISGIDGYVDLNIQFLTK